jgi:hypothetical protein
MARQPLLLRAASALGGAIISAARILAARPRRDPMCCSEHTIVVERHGQLFWRRHEWLANQWAPLSDPATSNLGATPETKRRGFGGKTAKVKPARRRSPR